MKLNVVLDDLIWSQAVNNAAVKILRVAVSNCAGRATET